MQCTKCNTKIDIGLKNIIDHQTKCKITIRPISKKLKVELIKLIKNLI